MAPDDKKCCIFIPQIRAVCILCSIRNIALVCRPVVPSTASVAIENGFVDVRLPTAEENRKKPIGLFFFSKIVIKTDRFQHSRLTVVFLVLPPTLPE